MALTDHVQLTITLESVGIARAGFGVPLILSHNASFPERLRYYNSITDVAADFADETMPEYRAARAMLSQNPRPSSIAIGRAAASVTQQYTLEVTDVRDDEAYSVDVDGEGFEDTTASYTSDSATSKAEIHNGLVTALNAVTDKNYLAAFAALVVADLTFVGEADDDTLTSAVALVNPDDVFTADNTTEIFTAAAHGLLTGDGPFQVSNGGGALPTGLAALTDYWIIRIDANTFYLATSVANALAGTHLSISTDGTGTQTIADTAETRRLAAHGLLTGDGPIRVSNSGGGLPTGLLVATDYWVISTGTYTFKLAGTLALALAGTAVALSTDGTGIQTLSDTASTVSPADPFTVTGSAAGNWFSLEVYDPSAISIGQTHTVSGLSADLDAILLEDPDWYEVTTFYNSPDYVGDVAAWTETNKRIYVYDTNETDSITTAYDEMTSTDTLAEMMNLGYARSMGAYHPRPAAMFAAAWMGRWLPTEPGAATTKFKTLSGVEAVVLTGTHRNNLVARRGNSYQGVAGRNITWEGTVPSTTYRYLDVVRNLDWLEDDMSKGVFGALAGADIIPYTPEGIVIIESEVRASCARAVAKKIFSATPAPEFEVPEFDDISSNDKEERILRDVKFSGTLAGAIHKVFVTGSVTF